MAAAGSVGTHAAIALRGVKVHNLREIDLDLQRDQLIVLCGVSGSGKTSLALDTLYAEGQRRYIESFSAYTRQFLERLDKPEAESIEGIPPAIAVTRTQPSLSSRSTVGTATETIEYLRLLFAKLGEGFCPRCGEPVREETPSSIADWFSTLPSGRRAMVVVPARVFPGGELSRDELLEQGFSRVLRGGRLFELSELAAREAGVTSPTENGHSATPPQAADDGEDEVLIDRVVAGRTSPDRLRESLETGLRLGRGEIRLLVASDDSISPDTNASAGDQSTPVRLARRLDEDWEVVNFSGTLTCSRCQVALPTPEPRLFSFNSPLGACPTCEGFGSLFRPDLERIIPDPSKTLREGAIAPWTSKAYSREFQALAKIADQHDVPLDTPYRDLTAAQQRLVEQGIPDTDFSGIEGFFRWLEKSAFKTHHRAFLSRWRSEHACPTCHGSRLRDEARAFRVGERSIDQLSQMEIHQTIEHLQQLPLTAQQQRIARDIWRQLLARLKFLDQVGLGYLTLDRSLRTLSGGEAQRVALTSALGSTLVNMLYILDEPTVGLHPEDVHRLQRTIFQLRDRGNTVVVVEHEPEFIEAADEVVEIGPGAGDGGGRIVFQGTPAELKESPDSVTADFLIGRRGASVPNQRRTPSHGKIRLTGARGNNLKGIEVEFPLGVLCLVTGVSGSGKSSLVQDTLYGALCRRKRKEGVACLPFDDVFGDGQIEEVVLVDQSPIGRTPRSNPVTYIKAFDDIRNIFAETLEARTRNLTASHFSFNVDGGRCPKCNGEGYLSIDMQFLADVYMRCPQCKGTRYRREILDVTYRGVNIAEVLDMSVRKAFSFFRGQTKLQAKLKRLIDVGLDYLQLGQPATTLSSGEAQRLKLATYTGSRKQQRTLFLLDEPTTGLHFSDIVKLIDCFEALLSVGHSLIVIEHNLQLMKAADYIIDMGPGASAAGGQVVAMGSPEEIAAHPASMTGRHLKAALAAAAESN